MMMLLLVSEAYTRVGTPSRLECDCFSRHQLFSCCFVDLFAPGQASRCLGQPSGANQARNRRFQSSQESDDAQRFEELEARLDGFETELEKMKSDAVEEAENEHNGILARAEEDAARIAESAQRSIPRRDRSRASGACAMRWPSSRLTCTRGSCPRR